MSLIPGHSYANHMIVRRIRAQNLMNNFPSKRSNPRPSHGSYLKSNYEKKKSFKNNPNILEDYKKEQKGLRIDKNPELQSHFKERIGVGRINIEIH